MDDLLKDMFPEAGSEYKADRIQCPDGTPRYINKEIKKSVVVDGRLSKVTVRDIAVDDFGEMIKSIEDVGGYCGECRRFLHKSNYFRCDLCGERRCRECVRIIGNRPYCGNCARSVRWRKFWNTLFGRKG
jgi:hypothetical protein